MKQITGYNSNTAFTHQMIGQQLLIQLGKQIGTQLQGYYKYHKITLFSTDPHLNHQIFIRRSELIEGLTATMKQMFGVEVIIKDIIFVARDKEEENLQYL